METETAMTTPDPAPVGSLDAQGHAYVMARPGDKCQQRKPGCLTTASGDQIAYSTIMLSKWVGTPTMRING